MQNDFFNIEIEDGIATIWLDFKKEKMKIDIYVPMGSQNDKKIEAYVKKNKLNFVALDESTTIKNRSAKRTKNILALGKISHKKRILTGSPITKSPLDLFTQCQFLSPELLGFHSYLAFRNRYAEMTDIPVGSGRYISVPKYYKRLEELEEKMKSFATRIRKDECLDLKHKVRTKRYIELDGEGRKIYDRLRTSALAIVEDSTISFSNKLTEIIKLHQVCNGFTKDDDGKILKLHKSKLNALEETLEEMESEEIQANYKPESVKKSNPVRDKQSILSRIFQGKTDRY